jgi:membrane protease YdiL (CAAX protease family)
VRRRGTGELVGTGVVGATLLRLAMSRRPGSKSFYALSLAVAATWLSAASRDELRQLGGRTRVLGPIAVGVGAFAFFCAAARVVRAIPVLDRAVGDALSYADRGADSMVLLTTCVNGIAEEVFFRGRLWSELPDGQLAKTTAAYTAVTAATGNPALVVAGAVMGSIFGRQRRKTGGLQAPVLTHLTWSVLMVTVLPRVMKRATR